MLAIKTHTMSWPSREGATQGWKGQRTVQEGAELMGRWQGRQLLEVISTEFRDRSVEYYVSPTDFSSKGPSKDDEAQKSVS